MLKVLSLVHQQMVSMCLSLQGLGRGRLMVAMSLG